MSNALARSCVPACHPKRSFKSHDEARAVYAYYDSADYTISPKCRHCNGYHVTFNLPPAPCP